MCTSTQTVINKATQYTVFKSGLTMYSIALVLGKFQRYRMAQKRYKEASAQSPTSPLAAANSRLLSPMMGRGQVLQLATLNTPPALEQSPRLMRSAFAHLVICLVASATSWIVEPNVSTSCRSVHTRKCQPAKLPRDSGWLPQMAKKICELTPHDSGNTVREAPGWSISGHT